MSETAILYPSSSPMWGRESFGYSSGLHVGLNSSGTYYYGYVPFEAISPSWHILSLKLKVQRTDSYATHYLRIGSNESNAWADRNTLDWSSTYTIGSGANTKTIDLTAQADAIKAYDGAWYLHMGHGSGSNSYTEFSGGTGLNAPRLEVEYEIASITPDAPLKCGTAATLAVMTPPGEASTYELRYSIGAASGVIGSVDVGATTEVPWTPALVLANEITTAVSGTVTLSLYDGENLLFSDGLALSIADDMVPSISGVTFAPVNAAEDTIGIHVQGESATKATISASSVYGATIAAYELTIGGKTYTGAGNEITSDALTTAGILNASVKVTDTRGRTATSTITGAITVYAYADPIITAMALARCTVDGTLTENGTYIKVAIACKLAALNDLNTRALSVKFRASGGSYGSAITVDLPATGDLYNFSVAPIIGGGAIGANAYDVEATLSDHYSSIVETETLPSAVIWFTLQADGKIKFKGNLDFTAEVLAALVDTLSGAGILQATPGKLIQYGSVSVKTNTPGSVNFPTAFNTTNGEDVKVFTTWAKTGSAVTGDWSELKVADKTQNGFTVTIYGSGSPTSLNTVDWMAIGPI